jgi:hypothetical protein
VIRLSFPCHQGPTVLLRAAFFRICADQTLRGPDGSLVARYTTLGWRLGARDCREFEATGPLLLRVSSGGGPSEQFGPYEAVRAGDGALFRQSRCLGNFCTHPERVNDFETPDVMKLASSRV